MKEFDIGRYAHVMLHDYTVQGWQSGIESTPFSMDLSYWAPVISGVSPSYGGNITQRSEPVVRREHNRYGIALWPDGKCDKCGIQL